MTFVCQGWVPADLTSLETIRKKNPDFAVAPGPWYMIAALGKETPFQNALVDEYRNLSVAERLACASLGMATTGAKATPTSMVVDGARVVHKVDRNAL